MKRGKWCFLGLDLLQALAAARCLLLFASAATAQSASHKEARPLDYNRDIRPVFSENCYACHGPDKGKRKAGLRLDIKEEAFKKLESGNYAIVPGHPGQSRLLHLITTADDEDRMPPAKAGKRLTRAQVETLQRWIAQGAAWKSHWSYLPPERPPVPAVKHKAWPRNEIDSFILARLEREGLRPSPEADRITLIRRLTLDLTGLPPTIQEADLFLADDSPDACEKLVDRLLASPAYGERMALNWLDLARYADTSGYHFDGLRFMWPWREWVINAFNQNLPFDEFTIEQLAGDLLPGATRDQKVATGFHRNVMTNDEGGADPSEYLAKYVVDRVTTTAAVWLGSTLGCAECHDHKYDLFTQKDFYRFYAFFHQVSEKGLDGTRTENPTPKLPVPSPEQESRLASLDHAITAAEMVLTNRQAELPAAQTKWEKDVSSQALRLATTNALLLHFTLDETLAGVLADGTSAQAIYKNTNAPVWLTGKSGQALKLDGNDASYVDVGHILSFERTNAFSFGCWMKYQENGGALFSKMEDAPGFRGFDLLVEEGKLAVHIVSAWPDNGLKVVTKEALAKDVWHHVMVTYDGSSKAAGIRIFAAGKPKAVEIRNDKLSETITNLTALLLGKRINSLPFHGGIDEVRFYGRELTPAEIDDLASLPNLAIVQIASAARTAEQTEELKRFFREHHATEFLQAGEDLAALKKSRADLAKTIPDTMVMDEMEKPRDTFILVRGNFQNKGEKVDAGVPSFLPPIPPGLPANRLGLAKWLVTEDQPLTSRVTVNRYWQMFFGTGLVKTMNDFGSQGEWPSHPELLDWLATEFVARRWDVKSLVKLIVTSATYRQSAAVTPRTLEGDPNNRLLSRGPRLRLDAEFIRDNALAISGLLNRKLGGESVKPYQPPGLWDVTDHKYEPSKGAELYRRGLYVYWKRAVHYPSFAAFDAPSRETCTVQRPRTSTPLQSLVLMNDPVYVEAARALAQRVLKESGPELNQRLTYAFRLALARPPEKAELEILSRTYLEQLHNFESDRKAADNLITIGESPTPRDAATVELAALTATANVLLNLNETITK